MKPFSVVVTGEPTYIKCLINCISYGPDELITHRFKAKNAEQVKEVQMNFGSLQVDEDNRIDFFGGNDDALFEFIEDRADSGIKGLIITLDADDKKALNNFKDLLAKHTNYLNKHALVIGVSGSDYTAIKQAEEQVRNCLTELQSVAPVFSIDPDSKKDVGLLVESLLCSARPGIHDMVRGKSSFELVEELD